MIVLHVPIQRYNPYIIVSLGKSQFVDVHERFTCFEEFAQTTAHYYNLTIYQMNQPSKYVYIPNLVGQSKPKTPTFLGNSIVSYRCLLIPDFFRCIQTCWNLWCPTKTPHSFLMKSIEIPICHAWINNKFGWNFMIRINFAGEMPNVLIFLYLLIPLNLPFILLRSPLDAYHQRWLLVGRPQVAAWEMGLLTPAVFKPWLVDDHKGVLLPFIYRGLHKNPMGRCRKKNQAAQWNDRGNYFTLLKWI